MRQSFRAAQSEETAAEQFKALAKITRKGKRRVAKDALLELARDSSLTIRRRSKGSNSRNNAVVSPAIRVLLRELHGGKCQICSFTFRKKSGDPYFEVHHIDPNVGDLPTNILVLCPNCHAQIEQADVCDFRRAGDWLVGVTINGKRRKIRQPFAKHSTAEAATILRMLFFLAQTGSSVISVWRV